MSNAKLPPVHFGAISLSIVMALTSAVVRADEETNKSVAEALFQDGKRLFQAGKYAEACRKFEASQKLDPAPGNFLNMAVCHEMEGRLATAYVELKDALAQAKKDGRKDRQDIATDHIATIEPKLPSIVFVVSADAPADLTLSWDGARLPREAWSTGFPADPGAHDVTAAASGYSTWNGRVTVTWP